MSWERHDNSIYDKVVHWFDVIKEEFCRSDVLPENAYNMDETGIMLFKLGSVKVDCPLTRLTRHSPVTCRFSGH
jgi:hypothetical protein